MPKKHYLAEFLLTTFQRIHALISPCSSKLFVSLIKTSIHCWSVRQQFQPILCYLFCCLSISTTDPSLLFPVIIRLWEKIFRTIENCCKMLQKIVVCMENIIHMQTYTSYRCSSVLLAYCIMMIIIHVIITRRMSVM